MGDRESTMLLIDGYGLAAAQGPDTLVQSRMIGHACELSDRVVKSTRKAARTRRHKFYWCFKWVDGPYRKQYATAQKDYREFMRWCEEMRESGVPPDAFIRSTAKRIANAWPYPDPHPGVDDDAIGSA